VSLRDHHHGMGHGLFHRAVQRMFGVLLQFLLVGVVRSDQQGMNKIMPSAWRYRRNGGNPRYEFNGVEYKC
jgi:hypothetical protein